MNNKRTLSKAGSIVSIVSWSINILLYIYLGYVLLVLISLISASGSGADASAVFALISTVVASLAISIVLLIYSIRILKFTKLDAKEFVAKKGTIIAIAVINILNALYGLFSLIGSEFDWTSAVSIVISLGLLASAVLLIVDFVKCQKEAQAEKLAEKAAATAEQENTTQTVVDVQVKEESVEDKIEKLNKMKADGLITEDEYNQMKSDLLK